MLLALNVLRQSLTFGTIHRYFLYSFYLSANLPCDVQENDFDRFTRVGGNENSFNDIKGLSFNIQNNKL